MDRNIDELFEKLNEEIIKYNPYYDKRRIKKAYLYANEAHKNSLRKSGEPFITHPLNVALSLAKLEADDISIIWALLHDVLDNKNYTIEDISSNFWGEIWKIVSWVNKLWDLYYTPEMTKKEVEELKQSLVLAWDDIRIFLIKIADRFHNLQTLQHLPKQKRYRIARETEEVYLPIVNFLSIWEFLTQMHDLCFKYTNEIEYKKLDKIFGKKYEYYKQKIISAHNQVEKEFSKVWLKVVNIEWRVKNLFSIYKKMKSKNLDLDDIYDVLALRIITKNERDAYIALWIVHKLYNVKSDRFKDYISSPKENWYQSIHTTVFDESWEFLEFQIQTQEMFKLNKSWLAAHFIYKWFWVEYKKLPDWMKWILDVQKKTIDSSSFFERLKQEVIISEIKCFDSNWNSILLPKDSVLIDFAFTKSLDYWRYFYWAYINGIFTNNPFIKLKNGDFIRLEKTNQIHIDYKIENFFLLKTKIAKDEIKELFKKYSSIKLIELWKYMLNNSLETYWFRHFKSNPQKIKKIILKNFWLADENQLYLFVATWILEVEKVVNKINLYYDKNSFNKEVSLKLKLKTKDFVSINNLTKIFFDLDINLKKLYFKENKNCIFVNFDIDSSESLNWLLKELKRAPNIANITRVFPLRLKIYYLVYLLSIIIISWIIFSLNVFNVSGKTKLMEIALYWSIVAMFFIIFLLKYIVKTILPDILRYKRFWLSLFLLNTFIFSIIFWEIVYLGLNIDLILFFIFCFFMYLYIYYDFFKYKKYKS